MEGRGEGGVAGGALSSMGDPPIPQQTLCTEIDTGVKKTQIWGEEENWWWGGGVWAPRHVRSAVLGLGSETRAPLLPISTAVQLLPLAEEEGDVGVWLKWPGG